ncbi:MAG: sarcosine oxidase subunit delta, partial [Rhizobiales bacterium]|nr:sarcosine oxidase subunit delta [Hyphomicrobiales bacterium]
MLVITCPVCGVEGEETDFHCGGEGHIARPATENPEGISDDAQRDYMFMRKNPK